MIIKNSKNYSKSTNKYSENKSLKCLVNQLIWHTNSDIQG
jgi:hypothetical protein